MFIFTVLFAIWNTTGLLTRLRLPCTHLLHFNCSKLSNHHKLDPCVRIEYDISDSELALELSPEVLSLTMRVWWTLHTEGMYPYHIQCIQYLEPVDMCRQLELCPCINSNPHVIRNIFFMTRRILPAIESTIRETVIYGIVIIHRELSKATTNISFL